LTHFGLHQTITQLMILFFFWFWRFIDNI
jgi:hypothetical protein